MGENISYPLPIAVFGVLQLACAIAYFILSRALIYHHGPESEIARAVGAGKKERISLAIYLIAAPLEGRRDFTTRGGTPPVRITN